MRSTYNGGVDAAARFHSTFAEPVMMRNTLPPLASNLLGGVGKRLLALQNNVESFQFVCLFAAHRFGKNLVAIFGRDDNKFEVAGT